MHGGDLLACASTTRRRVPHTCALDGCGPQPTPHDRARREAGETTTRPPDARPSDFCYLDLHTHTSDGSNDAGATVEGYLRWIARRREAGVRIDGFVLTEHRNLDRTLDYSALAVRYGAAVLRGIELETNVGHVLVYGVTDRFFAEVDIRNVALPYEEVFRAAREHGGIAVGAHAGRPRIGLAQYVERDDASLDTVDLVETLNGGSSTEENGRALLLARQRGLSMTGGSDSHYVSSVGSCLTAFREPIRDIHQMVEEMRAGRVHALAVEETVDEPARDPDGAPTETPD